MSSALTASSLTTASLTATTASDSAVDRADGRAGLDWFLADDSDIVKRKKKEQLNGG